MQNGKKSELKHVCLIIAEDDEGRRTSPDNRKLLSFTT